MSTNRFIWYELVTSDIDAGLAFYTKLLGWDAQEFQGGEHRYVIISAKGKGVGGVMPLPQGMSEPFWLGYIGVSDIDIAVANLTGAGGKVHKGPWEIPNVGRLALVSDPQGAGLALIQGASERPSEAFNQGAPGHGNWHELHTSDPERGFDFYARQFGWTKGEAMPMGPMGTYQLFKADELAMGGLLRGAEGVRPAWLYYFGVENINDTVARIQQGGGTVLHGPAEVPGGAQIVQAKDPQGAMVAFVGPAQS
ncbi:MAG: VOC family protein [Acetobacteraceae bacterium]|nr:VOC family protein [Acetobacteraceae bacterium]